jgi:hypothetical protein
MPIILVRYPDLQRRGIVNNRFTLRNWIKHRGFPPGRLIGPNTRAWSLEEVEAWIASRPVKEAARRRERDTTTGRIKKERPPVES